MEVELYEGESHQSRKSLEQPNMEYSLIDYNISQFLDLKSDYHHEILEVNYHDNSRLETILPSVTESTQEYNQETPTKKSELSVFHNFQKHLITLFKK